MEEEWEKERKIVFIWPKHLPLLFFPTVKLGKLPLSSRKGEFRNATIVFLIFIFKIKLIDALCLSFDTA